MQTQQAPSFQAFLHDYKRGELLNEASEQLAKLFAEVRATNKGGSLTLKITVKPRTQGNADMVIVADTIKLDLPELARKEDAFWLSEDGVPMRTHPLQTDLPLREVQAAPAPQMRSL
jgi:hypothetical protein